MHASLSGGVYCSSMSGHQEAPSLISGSGCSGPCSLLQITSSLLGVQKAGGGALPESSAWTLCPFPEGKSVSGTSVSPHTPSQTPQDSFLIQGGPASGLTFGPVPFLGPKPERGLTQGRGVGVMRNCGHSCALELLPHPHSP